MRGFFFFISLFIFIHELHAIELNRSSTSLRREGFFEKNFKNHAFKAKVGIENSSNAARLSAGQISGTSYNYEAGTAGYHRLSDNLFLISGINFNGKTYRAKVLKDNLDKNVVQTGLGASYFFRSGLELGVEGGFQYQSGREIDPFSPTLRGQESKKRTLSTKLYTRLQRRYTNYELALSSSNRRNITDTFDELGNRTNNSSRNNKISAKVEQKLLDGAITWKAEGAQSFRRYDNLTARFSNGALDNLQTVNPLKEIDTRSFNLGLVGDIGISKLDLVGAWAFKDDRIFDAEDSDIFSYSVKNTVSFGRNFQLELAYTYTIEDYDNFQAKWIAADGRDELRSDRTRQISGKLTARTGESSTLNLTYAINDKRSNYEDGTGFQLQSFKENVLSSDFNLTF